MAQQRPAVSGLNGKFEFSAGALTLPTPSFVGRAAGALTVPLGDRFGLQADFSVSSTPGYTLSAAVHAFTRDPSSYLVGASAGFVRSSGALVIAAGPEAELYRDRVSVEGWAGVAMVDPTTPGPTRFGVFALGTLAYYPTDNWRVSVGVSSLDNYAALQIGSEYLIDSFDLPVAATGEARIGQDGAVRILAGLRGYVGPDPHKSLIARQREDDPADLGSALYGAAGRTTLYGPEAEKPKTPSTGSGGTTTSETSSGQASSGTGEQSNSGPEEHATGPGETTPPPTQPPEQTPDTSTEWCTSDPARSLDEDGRCFGFDEVRSYAYEMTHDGARTYFVNNEDGSISHFRYDENGIVIPLL